ncbi:hypothetical protein BDQ17DRAFT_1441518 [Cyathus striatus]|nr:hypothetical protein BDQ17DRAFT_1441518 [Cyathus striatus]
MRATGLESGFLCFMGGGVGTQPLPAVSFAGRVRYWNLKIEIGRILKISHMSLCGFLFWTTVSFPNRHCTGFRTQYLDLNLLASYAVCSGCTIKLILGYCTWWNV